MKILIAYEESQRVTMEMRRLGHEAYSCAIEWERALYAGEDDEK